MSLPSEPTRPSERSEPLVSSQESHLRPNRGAPDRETGMIHPTGWLSALKTRALPLAVLSLVLNLILISVIIVILSTLITRPAYPVSSCPDGWVGYRGKCYYFSELEATWTDSQKNCSAHDASLAGIDSQQEMDFLMRYKGSFDHWIGLQREPGQPWKWANGTKFNNLFLVGGEEHCAFLNHNDVGSTGCAETGRWICSKPVQKPESRVQ